MSDHFSGPAVMGDPAVDITDLYAFVSPENPARLVFVVNVFPFASEQALFSDAIEYRVRVRGARKANRVVRPGPAEFSASFRFEVPGTERSGQMGECVLSTGEHIGFADGTIAASKDMKVFAGLRSDPFFMDVKAAIETDKAGRLTFKQQGENLAAQRDCLSMILEVETQIILHALAGDDPLIVAVAETVASGAVKPIRIERVGRPELKNLILATSDRDPKFKDVELRDLYNREDAFSLSPHYAPLYRSRLDANLAFFDSLDAKTAWQLEEGGRHPLRDLLLDDFLVIDPRKPFEPDKFLDIERSMLSGHAHQTCGGRWLNDDSVDDLLTLMITGLDGVTIGDGVDRATKPAGLVFPFLKEPNLCKDLPSTSAQS